MTDNISAIGVDLGGTKIEAGLVDDSGEVQKRLRVATDVNGGPAAVQEQIIALVKELIQEVKTPVVGMAIGVAGQIEAKTGVVRFAPNLVWNNVPLQENLRKALGMQVEVINDVRAATWGEWIYGAGKGCEDLICIFVGTGIGGGIISGGRLLTGCSNTCGEIGHMVIDFHGSYCTCGGRGCFEAQAGGWAIAKRAQDSIRSYGEAGLCMLRLAGGKIENVTAKVVVDAVKVRDSLAELVMEHTKQALIAGCVGLVNTINPCRLILGGGIIEGTPNIIPYIEGGIRQRALAAATHTLEVVPAKLHGEAGVIGGAALAMQTFKNKGVNT